METTASSVSTLEREKQKIRLPFGNHEALHRILDLHAELLNGIEVRGGAGIRGGS